MNGPQHISESFSLGVPVGQDQDCWLAVRFGSHQLLLVPTTFVLLTGTECSLLL